MAKNKSQYDSTLNLPKNLFEMRAGLHKKEPVMLKAVSYTHLALNTTDLQAYLNSAPELPLDGCAGKIVSGFAWRYVGLCSAKEGEKAKKHLSMYPTKPVFLHGSALQVSP